MAVVFSVYYPAKLLRAIHSANQPPVKRGGI